MKKMIFGNGQRLSRRKFVVGSASLAAGGLALGFKAPFVGEALAHRSERTTEVNIWVAIKPDDACVIRIARSEMGQGTLTGLAQLVAEELECDWKKVDDRGHQPGAQSRQPSAPGATWAPAAARASANRRTMSGAAAPRRA